MRVAIVGFNDDLGYSGGRYLSWIMAHALALAEIEVHYFTTGTPIFLSDFACIPNGNLIKIVQVQEDLKIRSPENDNYDFVILVPHNHSNSRFFANVSEFAKEKKAVPVLLNFESGNWYNKYFSHRELASWECWKNYVVDGGIVLSLTYTSQNYAKKFYSSHAELQFEVAYPAINNYAAKTVKRESRVSSKKTILFSTRIGEKHKGDAFIEKFLSHEFSNLRFIFLLGKGDFSKEKWEKLLCRAQEFNIELVRKYKLSDVEKFELLKRVDCVLFPTLFEGYGYPPVEARFCSVPCVTFDLPVLREVNGDEVFYAEYDNHLALVDLVKKVIHEELQLKFQTHDVQPTTIEAFGDNLKAILVKHKRFV